MPDLPPLPDLISLEAALTFAPPEGDQPRRFRMTAYDGGLLRLPNFPIPVVVDLKGMQRADQVKALLHHDAARPAGHMDRVEIDNTITTEGVLSVGQNAETLLAAQRNGFDWEASIGATIVDGAKEFIETGRSVSVNGRTFRGPLMVARKTMLREVSFVGVGAGEHTTAQIAAAIALTPAEASSMPDPVKNTETKTETPSTPVAPTESGVTISAAELAEIRTLKASYTAEQAELKKAREELQAETERLKQDRLVASVDRLCAQYGTPEGDKLKEIKEHAAAGKLSESDIELAIIRASYGNSQLARFQPIGGQSGAPANQHVIEAALCLTCGWDEKELGERGHFDEKTINAALDNRWRGFGLKALAIEHLRAHGHHVIGGNLQEDDVQMAVSLAEQDKIQAAGGAATLSLPGVLSNVARKESLRAFDMFPRCIRQIAKRSTASDYKPYYMYRVSTAALLEQVGADGELKSMELKEDQFSARVYPFGRKISINAVMMKNDDMGVFQDLSRLFGLTAARSEEQLGFTRLLSQQATFWTTDKGNRLSAGAGSALSLDSLKSAYELFLKMKDFTDQPIGIRPKYLLTGSSDAVLASELFTQSHVNLAAAGDTDTVVERLSNNPWRNKFTPLDSPYLDDGMVTNANGTQFLLLPDPSLTSPIVVAYLDGRAVPQVKTWDAIPGKMGMQWDATHNFGYSLHDDTGSVYSPGQ